MNSLGRNNQKKKHSIKNNNKTTQKKYLPIKNKIILQDYKLYSNKIRASETYDRTYNKIEMNANNIIDNLIFLNNDYKIFNFENKIIDSIIIKLAISIIHCVDTKSFHYRSNKFKMEFYSYCHGILIKSKKISSIDDNELLMLYLKQTTLILKNANIIFSSNGIAKIDNGISNYTNLYNRLFMAFWNTVKWEDIFPSMPTAAKNLKAAKNILINLLLKRKDKFRIDRIANTFFKISGFGNVNDLYLISFLDFNFFTWLGHFGIVNYIIGNECDPVMIELTGHGRKFLSCFIDTAIE